VLPSMSVNRNVNVPDGNGSVEASARVMEDMVVRFGTARHREVDGPRCQCRARKSLSRGIESEPPLTPGFPPELDM